MQINYKNTIINYTVEGKGCSVVLLHGFLETKAMWKSINTVLSKTYQVICIDLLGHGDTGCLGYVHSMEMMADAVYAVIKNLGLKKAHIIGHSMGGYVALALAEKQPALFYSLCLMNSTFEADDDERKALRKRANHTAKTDFETLVRLSFANLFAVESREKFKTEYVNALNIALNTSVQGYIAASEGMILRHNRYEIFKNLAAKKAIVIGRKDWIVNAQLLKEKTKNTDIEIIEFSEGHMSHIENSKEVIQFFEKFLQLKA